MKTDLKFTDLLLMRLHAERLRCSSCTVFLLFAAALVWCMALAEGVAWGYAGSQLSQGITAVVTGVIVAAIVVVIVFAIDGSLVLIDRAYAEHSELIVGVIGQPPKKPVPTWVTVGLRVAVLAGSMTVTAPYLAELVFHNEISHQLEGEGAAAIEAGRNRITVTHDEELKALDARIAGRQAAYEAEIGGKGVSQKHGDGPVASKIKTDIDSLKATRSAELSAKQIDLNTYNELARDPFANSSKLLTQYNVVTPASGPAASRIALNKLRKTPEFGDAELAIRAFLGLIFAGLLLLKLYEPSSVRLYLSEILQMEFQRYLAGAFDEQLPRFERSTAHSPIAPLRFFRFLVKVAEDARAKRMADLNVSRDTVTDEVESLREVFTESRGRKNEAVEALGELRSEIVLRTEELNECQTRLDTLSRLTPNVSDEQGHFEYRALLRRKKSETEKVCAGLNKRLPTAEGATRNAEEESAIAESRLRKKEADLEEVEQEIRRLRRDELGVRRAA